jgi:hypothetical protein
MPQQELLWGIDLGGTKIEGVVLTAQAPHKVLCRLRVPTEKQRGYDHIIHRIAELIDHDEKRNRGRPQPDRHRHPRQYGPHHRPAQKQQYHFSERATFQSGPRAKDRAPCPPGQRCQLLCHCRSKNGRRTRPPGPG